MITLLRDHRDGRTGQGLPSEVDRKIGVFDRLRHFIWRRRADAMLAKTLKPAPIGRVSQLSPHLLKDIGLPPDFRV